MGEVAPPRGVEEDEDETPCSGACGCGCGRCCGLDYFCSCLWIRLQPFSLNKPNPDPIFIFKKIYSRNSFMAFLDEELVILYSMLKINFQIGVWF